MLILQKQERAGRQLRAGYRPRLSGFGLCRTEISLSNGGRFRRRHGTNAANVRALDRALSYCRASFQRRRYGKGQTKSVTYEKVRSLHHAFKQEFGAVDCLELLHGEKPGSKKCHDKFPRACKIFEAFLAQNNMEFPENPSFLLDKRN